MGKKAPDSLRQRKEGAEEGSQEEAQDEPGEDLPKGVGLFRGACSLLLRGVKGQEKGHRDDHQGPGELHNHGQIPGSLAIGIACRCHRGSIVHRRPCPEAEGEIPHPQEMPQEGEEEGRKDIEEEDGGDGMGHFLLLRLNHRSGGRNGRAAADGRAYPDEGGSPALDLEEAPSQKGRGKSRHQGEAHEQEGLASHLEDLEEVHAEAQEDDGMLEHLLPCVADPCLIKGRPLPEGQKHPEEDPQNRASQNGEGLSQEPGRKGDQCSQGDSRQAFSHCLHQRASMNQDWGREPFPSLPVYPLTKDK